VSSKDGWIVGRCRIATVVPAFVLACALVVGETSVAAMAGTQKPLTTSQFVNAANKICRQTNKQRDALVQSYIIKLSGKLPDNATLAAAVADFRPIFQQEIDSLGALRPPKALQRKYRALLASARSALAAVVANPSDLLAVVTGGTSPFSDLSRRARALGLRDCTV
jgi:hypothetical protein